MKKLINKIFGRKEESEPDITFRKPEHNLTPEQVELLDWVSYNIKGANEHFAEKFPSLHIAGERRLDYIWLTFSGQIMFTVHFYDRYVVEPPCKIRRFKTANDMVNDPFLFFAAIKEYREIVQQQDEERLQIQRATYEKYNLEIRKKRQEGYL